MDEKTTTTKTTYDFDEFGKVIGETTVETVAIPSESADDNCKIETGIEMDGIIETSPLEVFLTAAIGALLGNLLYHAIHKD